MLIPGFAASFLLLFVEAIADLANPLVIGGDFTVLASRAYIAVNGEYNTAAGSAYSLILLVPALLVFLLQRYWSGRSSAVTVTGKPAGRVRMVTSCRSHSFGRSDCRAGTFRCDDLRDGYCGCIRLDLGR